MSILFDFKGNKPARLEKVEECPQLDNFSMFAGCMVVASSALLISILGGCFL